LPFGSADVDAFEDPHDAWRRPLPSPTPAQGGLAPDAVSLPSRGLSTRRIVAFGALGASAIGLGLGVMFSVRGSLESDAATPTDSQRGAAERNDRIHGNNVGAAVSYIGGGAAAVTGLLLLLWPEAPRVSAHASSSGVEFGYRADF